MKIPVYPKLDEVEYIVLWYKDLSLKMDAVRKYPTVWT